MAQPLASIVFDRSLGAIETISPWMLPSGFAASAVNVDLSAHALMRPRAGTATVSGATGEAFNMATIRNGGTETLWVFSDWLTGTPSAAYLPSGGSFTSVSLIDTPAFNGLDVEQCIAVAHNGKVFLAYNSAANRLHVWDGTSVRRVGLAPSAAATVANTGAGAYAAILRYYKIQWRIFNGTTGVTSATSELSPVVSFTPSGAGTAARVTKPTTPDGATHWCVYGSSDGTTYYNLTGILPVATTTYDDPTLPVAYSGGVIAPEAGLYVPPPSAKFLATNGERIFMAGAYETTAGTGETTPSARRVWFTRPLGVTDAGDDESITLTGASRYWIDIDNEDGSPLTGLLSTLDGSVYAGTATSLWRLYDTGQADEPIRAERVVAGVGPRTQTLMTATDTVDGAMVYFAAFDGPYRYSPSTGVQYLGSDWVVLDSSVGNANAPRLRFCQFDPESRRIFWGLLDDNSSAYSKVRVLDPSLLRVVDGVWRGGWSLHSYGYATRLQCAAVFGGKIHFGGASSGVSALIFKNDPTVSTDGGNAYTCSLTTPDVMFGDGSVNVRTEDPYIWKRRNLSVSLVASRDRGGSGNTVSVTAANESIGGGETSWHRKKVEGLVQADAGSLSFELAVTTPIVNATSRHTDGVDRLVVPYMEMERA